MSDLVTCEGLHRLCDASDSRVGVLMLLKAKTESHPNGLIQFVTWGRDAADKVESHNLHEWIKNEVFDGEPPAPEAVHESFILDAAKNKQHKDELLAASVGLLALIDEAAIDQNLGDETDRVFSHREFAGLRAAIAKATTTL